jgi:hypothetical protein
MEAGLVKVSDHLPIFAMVGGPGGGGQVEGAGCNQRRAVNERRMMDFVIALESWDFGELLVWRITRPGSGMSSGTCTMWGGDPYPTRFYKAKTS